MTAALDIDGHVRVDGTIEVRAIGQTSGTDSRSFTPGLVSPPPPQCAFTAFGGDVFDVMTFLPPVDGEMQWNVGASGIIVGALDISCGFDEKPALFVVPLSFKIVRDTNGAPIALDFNLIRTTSRRGEWGDGGMTILRQTGYILLQ